MTIISEAKYYFITRITESEDRVLEFELVCGITAEKEEDVWVGKTNLGKARAV